MSQIRLEPLTDHNIDIESCCCLTFDDEIRKESATKKAWLKSMMKQGLRAQLLFEDNEPAGFIEYQPIGLSPCPATGNDLYFINCLMVNLWDLGPGCMKGKGYGRMLVEAAERDVKENTGANGIVAWGLDHKFWFMPYTFFEHVGYKVVAQEDQRVLLVKKFRTVQDPQLRPISYQREPEPGKAIIDFFYSNQCPHKLYQLKRWRRITQEFDEEAVFNEFHTDKKSVMEEFGVKSGLFINGQEVFAGPMADDEIRDKVAAAIKGSEDGFDWRD